MLDIVCTAKFRPVTRFLFIVDKLHVHQNKFAITQKKPRNESPGSSAYCKEAIIVASSDRYRFTRDYLVIHECFHEYLPLLHNTPPFRQFLPQPQSLCRIHIIPPTTDLNSVPRMTAILSPPDNVPTWYLIRLTQNVKCTTNPCAIALSTLKHFTSRLNVRSVFRLVTVSVYLFQPCFRFALVLMSMAFVVVRIFTDKVNYVSLDVNVVRVVMVFYFDILVDYQIRLIRTPRKRFLS